MPADIPTILPTMTSTRYFRSTRTVSACCRTSANTTVTPRRTTPDGVGRSRPIGAATRVRRALIVANGHHWEPRGPSRTQGISTASKCTRRPISNPDSPLSLRGKRVMVVGFGNSAMDIACELGQRTVSERCLLSVRRMSWVMPKWVFGRPVTRQFVDMPHWIPWWIGGAAVGLLARIAFGRPTDYGLPKPDHRWFQSHPTISQEFYSRIGHGDVIVKPGIREFAGREVRFVDGSSEAVDAIVWCTGYKIAFPFFDDDFLPVRDNYLPLWMHTIAGIPNCSSSGYTPGLVSIMPAGRRRRRSLAV